MIWRSIPVKVSELSKIDELKGKLAFNNVDDRLMHSVIENDKKEIDKGKLIEQAVNHDIISFTPNLMFEQLVNDYTQAKNIYGETILRQLFGYDADYIERNINIPEFQKILRKNLAENIKKLKQDNILENDCSISEKGYELASLVMYIEELDNIVPKGIRGEWPHKKLSHYGSKENVKNFRKGDRYKDIALRGSLKRAIRRSHENLEADDLKVYEKESKGQCCIIYAIDASGSMKGKKIGSCKKAGIALAFKAIENKDKVGLIIFGEDIINFVEPTLDFPRLLKEIARIKAKKQTNIAGTIKKAAEIFPNEQHITKHLLLLTDAMPTTGEEPERETLEAVSIARSSNITISLIGIQLDSRGEKLAEKIVEIGQGKLYKIRDFENMDKIVLEDYWSVA